MEVVAVTSFKVMTPVAASIVAAVVLVEEYVIATLCVLVRVGNSLESSS